MFVTVAVAAMCGCAGQGRTASVIANDPPSGALSTKPTNKTGGAAIAPTTTVSGAQDTEVFAVPSLDGSTPIATDATNVPAGTARPASPGSSVAAVAPTTVGVPQSVSPTAPPGEGPTQAKRSFERFGYVLTDAEASCVAGSIDAGVLASLDRADLDVPTDRQLVAAVTALATCEPTSYMNYQVQALVGSYGVSADQGRCVTKAADRLAVSDAKIAAVMLDDWTVLGSPSRENLLAAVMSCVDQVTAKTIVTT
jgi:hypothetical protein